MQKNEFRCERRKELDILKQECSAAGTVVVTGIAGMGKSRLCRALKDQIVSEEKTLVQLDCLFRWDSSDFFSELHYLLTPLKDRKKLSAAVTAEELIDTVDKREIILIIDDFQFVECAETIHFLNLSRSLSKSCLIVFSRRKPDLDSASAEKMKFHSLNGLSTEETVLMIRDIFLFQGKNPPENNFCEKIKEISGGHPFSVKLICGLLISGRITLSDLETGLVSGHIEHYLSQLIWNSLSPETLSVMKILGIFRVPVEHDVITELAETDIDSQLEQLQSDGLAETDTAGKISLHDLLRRFILKREGETKVRELHEKAAAILYDKFRNDPGCLREAYYHFYCAGKREQAVDCLIELSRVNLFLQDISLDIIHLVRKELSGSPYRINDLKASLVTQLVITGDYQAAEYNMSQLNLPEKTLLTGLMMDDRGNGAQAQELLQKSLSLFDEMQMRLFIMIRIAMGHVYLGNTVESERCFGELSEISELNRFPLINAIFRLYFSSYCFMNCQTEKAALLIDASLPFFRKIRARSWIANALYRRGLCLMMMGSALKAENDAREAISIAVAIGDDFRLRTCYSLLGDILFKAGNFEESITVYEKGLELCRKLNLKFATAMLISKIGYSHLRMFQLEKAGRILSDSLQYLNEFEDLIFKVTIICNYAELLIVSGKPDEALEKLNEISRFFSLPDCPVMASYDYYFLKEKACILLKNHKESEKCREILDNMLKQMPENTRNSFIEGSCWLNTVISNIDKLCKIYRKGGNVSYAIIESAYDYTEAEYELIADFTCEKCMVDGKTVRLFSRKAIAQMFKIFCREPGKTVPPHEFYPQIWGRSYDHSIDCNTFRMNISRLRRVLDPDAQERFITGNTEGKGYTFNPDCSYLVIFRVHE